MSIDFSNCTEKNDIIRNLESFACVWLDGNLNEKNDDNRKTEENLRRIINHLYISNNEKKCQKYIENINQEKVILIVSGTIGKNFVSRIHHLPQLSSCYIFCGNIDLHKIWAIQFSKIKGVYNDINKLIEKISEDQSNRYKYEENASISVINQNSYSIEERNRTYMWFQLYIEVLIRMHHKLNDRKELIDIFKRTYKDNKNQLDLLNEFEKTYKSENAIWWYTRESCLYRILNKALRCQDYDVLFSFRFFITDIAKQIKNEYDKFNRKDSNRDSFKVYRGQIIQNAEIELMKKNIGQYLSMNSFFSTSLNHSTALNFTSSLTIDNNLQQKILFQIHIDPKLQTKPFVNVSKLSFYENEDEILIMLGAFFYIEKISYDEKYKIWIAYLSLADETDFHLKDSFNHMKQKIGQETNLASLGKILFEMGEYNQVEKCYQHMMYQAQIDLSIANSGLSKAALGRKDFIQAAQYEEKALEIKKSILSKNHRELAISYSRLGDIYCKQEDFQQALYYLRKAGKIQEKLLPNDPLILGKTYQRIAMTCLEMNDYNLAMEFFNEALKIRKEHLPPIDKSIASTYHKIGKLFFKQLKFDEALKYYNQAYHIYKQILPVKHPDLIQVEQDIQLLNQQM